jgi:replicative DNA helicase
MRVPPSAPEVEKHVIGAMLCDENAAHDITAILSPDDFYLERHRILFRAISQILAARMTPDMITVPNQLKKTGHLAESGGEPYLFEIAVEVVSSANCRNHAKIVREKALLRRAIQAGTRLIEAAWSDGVDPKQAIETAAKDIFELETNFRERGEGLVDMATGLKRYVDKLRERAAGLEHRLFTGINAIDAIMRGLKYGHFYAMGARPGLGKSALALQTAVTCKKPTALFSLEMLIEEEYERMMALENAELNGEGLSTPAHIMAKQALLSEAIERLSGYPIWICDQSAVTVQTINSECRRMRRELGSLDYIIVDYLQLVKSVEKSSRRDLDVGGVSTDLKITAKELNVPLLAVCGLSRKPEERENKRPIASDFRDAGQIESDANGILLIYRESKYKSAAKNDPLIKDICELIIPKNRGGGDGVTLLNFNGPKTKFSDVESERQRYYWKFITGKSDATDGSEAAKHEEGKSKWKKKATPPAQAEATLF